MFLNFNSQKALSTKICESNYTEFVGMLVACDS